MADVAKRPFGNPGSISQSHRDVTDDRYRDLRRPRKVKFYCNGDRYFKGKRLFITPHRYLTFNDLLNDLTGKLPSSIPLPYGVRSIYTPCGGQKIKNIDELQDGGQYVCAGFEPFKQIQYGKESMEPWLAGNKQNDIGLANETGLGYTLKLSKNHKHDGEGNVYGYNYSSNNYGNPYGRAFHGGFHPSRSLRNTYPKRGYAGYNKGGLGYGGYGQNDTGSMKPKVVTVIRNGNKPRNNVKILLNRRSVQSYEQLIKDISEAFGPKWKNNKVRRLFSIRGKEAHGVSDFFRDDDVFIAVGNDSLTTNDVQEILEELYPDSPYSKNLMKEWEKTKKKQQNKLKPDEHLKDAEASKIDSGLGSDESARDEGESVEPPAKSKDKKKKNKRPYDAQDEDLVTRLERERVKYAELERERARKRMQKRLDAEQRALNEERRRRGMVPIKPVTDPFKKMQEDREREKREAAEQEKARREDEEKERQREHEKEVKAAKARAKKAAGTEEDTPKVIVVVKGDKDKDEGKGHKAKVKDKVEKEKQEVEVRSRSPSPVEKKAASPERKAKSPEKEKKRVVSPERKVKETKDIENEEIKEEKEIDKEQDTEKDSKKVKDDSEKDTKKVKDIEPEIEEKEKETVDVNANKTEENTKNKTDKPADSSTKEEKKDTQKDNKEPKKQEQDPLSEKKKKQKSKIIRKSKIERQISNLDHVLNKYEPGRVLGDGNFAIVKTCTLKNSPQEYAMKIVDKSKLKGKEHMIENEIEIMKQCSHNNIVKLIEEFETHTEIYLIMELVKGGDLFDAITQSVKFDEKTSAGMITDLTNALFYLHSRSIVHRDLKPENLLVLRNKDGSMSLKLADFGLAMDVKEPIFTVCGTPTYVAPEILSEIGYGLEVDMWATGVITYILLCGFPPFRSPDRNQTELFEFIKAGEYEFLSPYWDKTSRAAKDLISRLLIVEKRKRYTAIDVLCHPWIITTGGTKAPSESMDSYRKNLRTDLDSQAKLNRESYVASKKALKEHQHSHHQHHS